VLQVWFPATPFLLREQLFSTEVSPQIFTDACIYMLSTRCKNGTVNTIIIIAVQQATNTPPNTLTYHVPSPLYCFFYVFSSSLSLDPFFLQTHLLHCLISLNRPNYSLSFLNFSFHNLHSHQKNIKDNYYYFFQKMKPILTLL